MRTPIGLSRSSRVCLIAGASAAALAVTLGAFGAHALQEIASPERLRVWRTAVDYHFYHALALLLLGTVKALLPANRAFTVSAVLFGVGIVVFSGSLYLLVLTDTRWLGAVTPLGGVAFILGWLLFVWGAWRRS